jgi:hypothetical protein
MEQIFAHLQAIRPAFVTETFRILVLLIDDDSGNTDGS